MDDLDKELDDLLKDEDPANGDGANPPAPGAGGNNAPPQGDLKVALRKSRDRSRTLAEENARLQAELEKHKPKDPPVATPSKPEANDIEERVDLRLAGYSKEEIDFVGRNRKDGQSLSEAAKDPFVTAAIEGLRQKAKIQDATPQPSNRGGVPIPPGKRPRDLSPRERAKLQEEILARRRAQR